MTIYQDADGDRFAVQDLTPMSDDPRLRLAAQRTDGSMGDTAAVHLSLEQVQHIVQEMCEWLAKHAQAVECPADPDMMCAGNCKPEPDGPAPGTILEDAQAAVYGSRGEDYGHPREDFTRQAILWTGLLHHKLADGEYIEAEDIARCMIAVKLARDVHAPKRDNRVDGAGYFLCLDRLETGK